MAALLYLITLLSLPAVILTTLAKNISIDCGSTGSYVDSNDVTWVGDKGFVTTGEPLEIPDVVTKPMNTLRYFPTGKTNCYTNIPVTKGRKTLVRTSFKYENYDGKFSPPSFDVIYDGKHRDSIQITDSDEENFYFSEVIFAPVNENISVCFSRTSPSDNPFISSIEVYSMDVGMYNDLDPKEGLILQERIAYGAKEFISYPLDPYGRLWNAPGSLDNPTMTIELSSLALSIDITGASNKPREIVMSKAYSGYGLYGSLSYPAIPLPGSTVYMVLYFSEPESLGRTQRRSFNVFLDTTQVGSRPIVPVFGKATQFVLRDVVPTSMSQIIFKSTDDSNLPPLINGLELYSISNSNRVRDTQGPGATEPHKNNAVEDIEPLDVTKTKGGRKKKKNKLPLIFGVTFASAFAILSSGFGAIFFRKRQNAIPHSNTTPTMSTGHGTGTGMSPLVEQQFVSDTNDSYVVQDEQH
ncbi:hypothetical protein CARUB_v10017183mg [Capsella rubella]|uniref:Malectin-like domain-containing protein n=1 Tax=Capsella rubella TaxID=81985 RepID=R0HFU3_9BRAS|nr:uncharacterized protein At1g24485 [Capsella rubella]EOA23965.1 hypothetical protein CARUB_v10017183mg [Capsella rubella]